MAAKTNVEIQKIHTYTGHKDAVYTIEAGGEDQTFYSAGGDGLVIEWNLNNPENGRLIAKIPASVYALQMISEKDILIVGQNYEGIHLINVKSLQEEGSLKLTDKAIFDIKTLGDLAVVAAGDGELYFIDLPKLQVIKKSVIAEKNLRTVLFVGQNRCLVGTSDGQIITFDLETLEIIHEIPAHENSVFVLSKKEKDDTIVSGSRDARLKFWKDENLILDETINAHMYAINDLAFDPSGHYFATASMDKTIKIWDYDRRKLIKVIDKARHSGHLTSVNKLIWSRFNNYLISCSDDRSISVWNVVIAK